MKEFTFVVLTFEQAAWILQHLESIRYQIETWGREYAVHLILSDDGSQDETVPLARAWLRDHVGLFAGTQLLTTEQNQGIVQNYLRALHAVRTERFKILAGDDLYYKNNVFAAAQAGPFVMSPVLYFRDDAVLPDQYKLRHWVFQEFIHHEGRDLKQQLLRRQKINNCICTPGVFYGKSLADAQMDALLRDRHWMEDYPLWNHLLAREELEPSLVCRPVVLYRAGAGISARTGHKKHSAYTKEYLEFLKEIGSPFSRCPLRVNPYRYLYYALYFAKGLGYGFFVRPRDIRVDRFLQEMQLEEHEAGGHLREMCKRAECWRKEREQDEG